MPSHSRFTLLCPYFRARTAERQEELDYCLARNLEVQAIERILLLVDDGHQPPVRHAKLEVMAVDGRPTYRQWIELSRSHAPGRMSVLANSDIHFDDSLPLLGECLRGARAFVALSRYEMLGDTLQAHPNPDWSQDVWAVRDPGEVSASLLARLDVPLGVPRCDNKVAYLFAIHGWSVFNPQRHVRSVHVHQSQQRHYDKKSDLTVIGAVAYVPPGEALTDPSQLQVDIWALNTQAIGKVMLNRSLDNWEAERNGTLPVLTDTVADTPPDMADPSAGAAPGSAPPTATGAPAAATAMAAAQPLVDAAAATAARTLALRQRFTSAGRQVFDHLCRFGIYRLDDELLALDWLDPATARVLDAAAVGATGDGPLTAATALAALLPPVLSVAPLVIGERPFDPADCQFWQYPCSTEKQALDNHAALPPGSNVDAARRTVSTYLGLPWASYIDKKQFPPEVLTHLVPRIQALTALTRALGYQLQVHTVCQQIYWRRLKGEFHALGVTDLHLSHGERGLDAAAEGWRMRLHSWPLIAPNVEVPARRAGLHAGRPAAQRRWLASFIGAHMPHYRSDVRLRLFEAARGSGRADVLVDLGDEWHFNKVVYKEQVAHKALSDDERQAHDDATRRYNEALSDSRFSLCPEGAGPNTLRVWESLAAGAIPVVVAPDWLPPPPRAPGEPALDEGAVFVTAESLPGLFEHLASLPAERVQQMQDQAMRLYAHARRRTGFGLLPFQPNPLSDAAEP